MKKIVYASYNNATKYKYKELHLNSHRGKTNKRLVSKHL